MLKGDRTARVRSFYLIDIIPLLSDDCDNVLLTFSEAAQLPPSATYQFCAYKIEFISIHVSYPLHARKKPNFVRRIGG